MAASSGAFAITTVTSAGTPIGDSFAGNAGLFSESFDLDLGTSGSNLSLSFANFTDSGPLWLHGVALVLYNSGFTQVAAATWSASGLSNVVGSFSGLNAGAGTDYTLTALGLHTFTPSVTTAQWGGTVAVVPEPSTYALLLAGLGVVGFMARRRRPVEG